MPTDYDAMAGSLMAGDLIECGACVTGGNFCGFQEIECLHHVGYPIAEIFPDGTSVITMPDHGNRAATVDTIKTQLLYEIQGLYYLNPDVIAQIDGARLEENRMAVHFVICGILQDGVSSSSILDGFGNSVGEFIRARHVDLPKGLLQTEQRRKPRATL